MLQQIKKNAQVDMDQEDPYAELEKVANEYHLTLDTKGWPGWVFVKDVKTDTPLTAFQNHNFAVLTAPEFEAAIVEAIEKYEPKPVSLPNNSRRRSIVTGRFKREERV